MAIGTTLFCLNDCSLVQFIYAHALMHTFVAICLLAATANGPAVHPAIVTDPPATHPTLAQPPKSPNGLTLYNAQGERVAQCEKKDDVFTNCKMDAGMTFDDVMNAWVHALEDMQK